MGRASQTPYRAAAHRSDEREPKNGPARFDASDGHSLAGNLLVASPGLEDETFERTVILLCLHDSEKAMGLVLNREFDGIEFDKLLEQLDISMEQEPRTQHVLDGGPVGQERGLVIHSPDFFADASTMQLCEGICLTSTPDALSALVSLHPPKQGVLALGHAGWGPGQLEDEISDNAWLLTEASPDLVFSEDLDTLWERAIERAGISLARYSGMSGEA
jgi:putative transcriptional regulator